MLSFKVIEVVLVQGNLVDNRYKGKQLKDHKAPEAIAEFIGNWITDKIVKTEPIIDRISRNVEEIIIPSELFQERRNLEGINASIIKTEH